MQLKLLREEEIITIHDSALFASGGLGGLSLDKSLSGAIHRIHHHLTYEDVDDIYEIAALYAIVIAKGHVFNDGNKRTAMISMINFLSLNDINLVVSNQVIENMMVKVAEKKISKAKLISWIKKHSKR
jgi:death-on-curing protein